MTKLHIPTCCSVLLAAVLLVPSTALAGEKPAACAEGGTKVEIEGPSGFACPEGQVLTGICVKAGTAGYGVGDGATENGPGCYEYSGIGSAVGSVGGGGTSRDCKGISQSHFYCSPGEPPGEPVCGDGEVEGDEQCDPPGRINELLVCNELCRIVEVPEPEPEPVCGNGVVEAGEACDPPGPLGERLVCTETCQISEEPPGGEL